MNRFLTSAFCVALGACTGAPDASGPDGVSSSDAGQGGDAGGAADAAFDPMPETPPSASEDAGADGASESDRYIEPSAAAPCGSDLNFVGGHAMPDFGPGKAYDASDTDPSVVGPYAVFEKALSIPVRAETRDALGYNIVISDGKLDATVYAPSSDDGQSVAAGPFALVIGAPGFQAGYADYAGYFRHFASHGFFVVGVQTRGSNTAAEHDKEALETLQVIDYMLGESPYRAQLDPAKVGAAGHSKGGKVSFFAAALDPRIDLVFGWDPSNAGGPPCGLGLPCNALPVAPNCLAEKEGDPLAQGVLHKMRAESFVFGVPPDALTNPTAEHNSLEFYRGSPAPSSLVYFNGGHAAWVESGLGGLLGNAEIIKITKTVQTAKLLKVFYGATGLDQYLPKGSYLGGFKELVRQVETK